jgi:hypothetical protein
MSPDTDLEASGATLRLPTLIISPTDIARLSRELETLEDLLRQAHLREPNVPARMPRTSSLFEELGILNKLNLLDKTDRQKAASYLENMKNHAPVVHISFVADPSAEFMTKLVSWLRRNIHPRLLVRIGLQPTLAAGCIVRTNNHVFDFSLRRHLLDSRPILIDSLQKNAKQT